MTEVYKIGVEIALAGSIMQGLEAISAKLLGINRDVKLVEAGFKGWGLALGGLGILGGVSVLGGLKAIADKHHELLEQQNKLYRATKDWQGVVNLTSTAYGTITKAVPSASGSDVLRSVNELRTVVGSMDKAKAIAPMSLMMESVLHNLTGKDADGEGYKIWRALEMKGITTTDMPGAQEMAMQMVRVIAGSGGKITPDTFQDLAGRGGAAWQQATPAALGPYSVAAGDIKGSGFGTALMTLDQLRTGATTMSRQQLDVLQQAGLIDMDKVHKIAGSNSLNIEPGAIYNSAKDEGNDFQWVQDIQPKLKEAAAKLAEKDHVTPGQALNSMIAKLGRNRNAIKLLHMFSDPGFVDQQNKDIDIWGQGMALPDAYYTMQGMPGMVKGPGGRVSEEASNAAALGTTGKNASYAAVMESLTKQWNSLMEAVGGPVASAAIPVMRSLTEIFNNLGSIANAHPEAVQMAAKALGVLGLAMIALGGGSVIAAAVAILGPVGAAITAVGTELTAFAALNWAGLSDPITNFYDSFNGIAAKAGAAINSAMNSIAVSFIAAIMSIPGALASAIASMGASIKAAIAKVFGGGSESSEVPRHGPPRHPSGMGPQDPHYDHRQSSATPIHVRSVVMLDRRVIGEAMSSEMLRLTTFPRQAPYRDSYAAWGAPDDNFATG